MNEKDTIALDNSEKWYNCNMCDYRVKQKITLNGHINTNHSGYHLPDGMASNIVDPSYFSDECEYSCQNKKS